MSRSLSIAILLITGCTAATDEDTDAADTEGNETSQLGSGDGKGDGTTTPLSTDPRLLKCRLEYETFTPPYGVRPAADFDETFAKVENEGAFASDGAYLMSANTNKRPPSNLSFVVMILDAPTGKMLSYNVMPRPHVGGTYLFEIGAKIPPVTFPNETTTFDFLRAYCSIRMP